MKYINNNKSRSYYETDLERMEYIKEHEISAIQNMFMLTLKEADFILLPIIKLYTEREKSDKAKKTK